MTQQMLDGHGHVWTTEDRYPWVDEIVLQGATKLVYNVDDYRSDMETLGVTEAVLVATPIHGPGSPYTVECVENAPGTFYGVVLVDHESATVDADVCDLLDHEGIVGVRITGRELESTVTDAFWERMNDLGAQVHLLLSPERLDRVHGVIEQYPDITFLFDHLALFPSVDEYRPDEPPYGRIERIASCSNAAIKVTYTPSERRYLFLDVHDHVRALYEAFGPDRLVWGSDYIYHFKRVTPWQTSEFVDELEFLSDADRRKLFGDAFRAVVR
jgi:predicted TIM-barrel fold metal-dependent hydrolase